MKRCLFFLILLVPLVAAKGQCADSTSQGRDFWFSTPLQLTRSLGACDVIAVSDTEATVTAYTFGYGYNQPSVYATTVVPADSATTVFTFKTWPGPFHVVSTAPVSLYVTFRGQYFTNVTNAIAPVLPSVAAGSRYVVQDYVGSYPYECHNVTSMVALLDSTRVDFTLPYAADNLPGGYGTHTHYTANHPYTFFIRTGGVHELNAVSGGHLSGMEMVSDGRPFVVQQGYQNMSVTMSYSSALHMFEPVLPVQYWGTDFVLVTPHVEQDFTAQCSILVRATALYDSTVLWLDGQVADTIDALQTAELALQSDSAYRLRASGPVEVYLYLVGGGYSSLVLDPEQVLVPDVSQGLENHTFYVLGNAYASSRQLHLVAKTSAIGGIALDGTPISAQFQALDSSYSYCRIDIDSGVHHLASTQGTFISHVVGYASTDTAGIGFVYRSDKGFAYLTGMAFKPWTVLEATGHVAGHLDDGGVRICLGDTVHFRIRTATEDTTVQWFVDGTLQSGEQGLTFRHLFGSEGTHEVSAIVGGRLCDTLKCAVMVGATYSDTLSVSLCEGQGYQWHDSIYSMDGFYNWEPGIADGCDSMETLHITVTPNTVMYLCDTFCTGSLYSWHGQTLDSAGLYVDTVYVAGGCDTIMWLKLDTLPRPHVSIGLDTSCNGYSLSVFADSAYYRWSARPSSPELAGHEVDSVLLLNPTNTTVFTLEASYSPLFDCPSSIAVALTPITVLDARMRVVPQALTYDAATLLASDITEGLHQRYWYINGLYSGDNTDVFASFDMGSDSVEVMLVVEANGCTDTALCVIPVLRNSLWAPNVFTPGQDNNVLFRPVGEGIVSGEMYIYRRNGMIVTHLKDYTVGWDGRCHGKLCPEETYVWVLIYNTADNRRLKAVGTVTLLY